LPTAKACSDPNSRSGILAWKRPAGIRRRNWPIWYGSISSMARRSGERRAVFLRMITSRSAAELPALEVPATPGRAITRQTRWIHPDRPPGSTPEVSATIVVVDDDPVTLTLVERSLRSGGYRVWTATGAAEARQLLAELAGAVDLVLTDVSMPGGLGTDLARQIGSSQRWVRVLLMSSYSRDDLREQGIDVPELHLLRKPFAPPELLRRIDEALAT